MPLNIVVSQADLQRTWDEVQEAGKKDDLTTSSDTNESISDEDEITPKKPKTSNSLKAAPILNKLTTPAVTKAVSSSDSDSSSDDENDTKEDSKPQPTPNVTTASAGTATKYATQTQTQKKD